MNKEELIKLIDENLSQRQIAERLNISQTTVRYWLKKLELKTQLKIENKKCKYCSTTNFIDFKTSSFEVCIKCENQKYIQRWIRLKKEWINYLGGKCQKCSYNKYYGALEFHHRDPNEKDGSWNDIKKWSKEKIKAELDKCDLLCSNCHRETHAGVV